MPNLPETPIEWDKVRQARKLAARIESSIDSYTWSLREIRQIAREIQELLNEGSQQQTTQFP